MSGVHRGRRGLRWRLVVAVMAAAVGRGYRGRHRLEVAALGLAPTVQVTEVRPADVEAAADAPAREPAPRPADLGAPLPLHVAGAQLAVVPVPSSLDPLVDTMPHPVIKLFPMPVVDHDGAVVAPARPGRHEAVIEAALADVDAQREAAALAELADPASGEPYHGRHTA